MYVYNTSYTRFLRRPPNVTWKKVVIWVIQHSMIRIFRGESSNSLSTTLVGNLEVIIGIQAALHPVSWCKQLEND